MADTSPNEDDHYEANPKLWIIVAIIACVSVAVPLYVYFTKKYCPDKLPQCFKMRGEPEHWPQRQRGGMFAEDEDMYPEHPGHYQSEGGMSI